MKYITTHCALACLFLMVASNAYADKYDRQFEKNKRKHHLQVKDSLYFYSFVAEAKAEVDAELQKDYTWYYNNSLHTTKGNYSGKLLDGDYTKYYSITHGMAEKGSFKDGLKVGAWYTWAENGNILTYSQFKKGYRNGKYREYADSSKLIQQGKFKKDKKSGTWKSYNPNGELLMLSKYKDGKQNGKHVEYTDGKKSLKGKYRSSLKKGNWKTYGNNGKLTSLTHYRKDVRHGLCVEKDSQGHKERVCWYRKGKLNGKCRKYKDGEVTSVEKYRDGKLVPEKLKEKKDSHKKDKAKKEKTKPGKK